MPNINWPVGRVQIISAANNGDLFILGNTSNEADVGGWMLTLMPDAGGPFQGAVTLARRPEGKGAFDNAAGFMPSPYKVFVLNNVAQVPYWDVVPLTGATEICVPANGTSIGFWVQCTQGTARVYNRPVNGPTSI